MKIDIQSEKDRFTKFVSDKENKNIVFSGIFGIGKTYFLRDYFKDNPTYEAIYLSPINYSIANNEDIFEYIKVDILLELLQFETNFRKVNCSFSLAIQMYILYHSDKLVKNFFMMAEKIKFGTNYLSRILALKEGLERYRKEISIDEKEDATKFINEYALEAGTIFENDTITQLIRSLISTLKDKGKEIVLIIDDLDRIDPEHIFRILNVLSAHDNFHNQNEHKFGFDKTILVCDIDNIRNIYHSKYGINVDFNGYIDKFFSKEIYYFDNTQKIIENISDILSSLITNVEGLNDKKYNTHSVCTLILSILVKNNKINTRTLLKYPNKKIILERFFNTYNERSLNTSFPCFIILDFIRTMFCTFTEMENAIMNLKTADCNSYLEQQFLCLFLALADYPNNKFKMGEGKYLNIKYKADKDIVYGMVEIMEIEDNGYINLKNILKGALINYKEYFL